jgi:P-type Mg2+ transporter
VPVERHRGRWPATVEAHNLRTVYPSSVATALTDRKSPTQILLSNFVYDLSQLSIPTDNVDPSWVARPRKWDTGMIQRFMCGLGPVSSLFDFITFGVMLWIFNAGSELFRAGWFFESLATQTLVIFVIRTAGNPFRSRPSRALVLTVIGGVTAGLVVVVSPVGSVLGFATLPPLFFGVLVVMTVTYLCVVQVLKRRLTPRAV